MMPEQTRQLVVLDAPSNLGLRPPEEGLVPGCFKAPGVLRDAGLLNRLGAQDGGVVTPGRYRPDRAPGTVRNEAAVADHSLRLAERLEPIMTARNIALVLGGDCSILVGIGLALRRNGRFGLVSFDGLDYRNPANSDAVGGAAGESLALVTGLGGMLANLEHRRPYVQASDVVAIGARPDDEYAAEAMEHGLRVIDSLETARDPEGVAQQALHVVQRDGLDGFWVHVDADVIDPAHMPAVDTPEPGGLTFEQLSRALELVLASPRLIGLDLTIYDPDLDPDFHYGQRLADLLVDTLTTPLDD